MLKNKGTILSALLMLVFSATAGAAQVGSATKQDYLVKFADSSLKSAHILSEMGVAYEPVAGSWFRVDAPKSKVQNFLTTLRNHPEIEYVQPNYKIHLLENYEVKDAIRRAALMKFVKNNPDLVNAQKVPTDNPEIPDAPAQKTGSDPDYAKQWGMVDIGVKEAWNVTKGDPKMIVAVLDTGVEYTHEDLVANIWRNENEIPKNGIDDDKNGYIDDVIGWDFVSNDNKPFDLAVEPIQLLTGEGNPGHGTHCAGNVGARADNGIGTVGVAPNVKIMPLRFISEKGQGTTADAIKAIHYAVDNGAKVLSNSWGSEGEDPAEDTENKALREAINYAQNKGTLFIAAAGNGHQGVGYNNDTDAKPGYPASYDMESIVSIAAIDNQDQLGSFSNWGAKSVDMGAPGVKVFSTTVGGNYSDMVIDMYGFKASWDGTSMATPHVAGAAALYWSAHPEKTALEVKAALLNSSKKINSLANKTVSGGKLDVKALLKY